MNRWLTMAGLAIVLVAAAVLSFAALRDLALAVRVHDQLAFLLPIAVDAGAAVSCAVWLSPTARQDARRFACCLTWALLVTTVVGNAAQLGMHANGIVPPWWVAVAVGAVPPAVVGGVVHLLVLVGRGEAPAAAEVIEPVVVEADEPAIEEIPSPDPAKVDEHGLSLLWQTAPVATPLAAVPTPKPTHVVAKPAAGRTRSEFLDNPPAKAIELAQQHGKNVLLRKLQEEFGDDITEHTAKELRKRFGPNGHRLVASA